LENHSLKWSRPVKQKCIFAATALFISD
jgi:hypothetical protein